VGNGFFIVLLLLFAVMWFMLIRPQRAQQKRHQEMLGGLKVGDEIVTSGGIYGEVVQLDTERVMVEVDDDVRIAVARRAIASIIPPEELKRLEEDEPEGEPETAPEALTAEERDTARK
jgi:preprotein translocase subunit YajC